jgi:hypothetical protein
MLQVSRGDALQMTVSRQLFEDICLTQGIEKNRESV